MTTSKEKAIALANLTSALAGALVSGSAEGVYAGSDAGSNAARNNAVAFHVTPQSAGGNGHMTGYFQDENGQWHEYNQYAEHPENVTNIFKDYEAGISITLPGQEIRYVPQLYNMTDTQITQWLQNDPNTVYIDTLPSQDVRITNQAFLNQSNPAPYNVCLNNCVDSVQSIFRAGGVRYPIDFDPRPNSYFEKLKQYYPNNYTNQSYDN